MRQPQRFKETSTCAGRLMTAGSEEKPPANATQRAAETLGIPLSVLSAVVSTAGAHATGLGAAAKVPATVATSTNCASVSGLPVMLAKGAMVGFGVGLALFAAAELVRSPASTPSQPSTTSQPESAPAALPDVGPSTSTPSVQREALLPFSHMPPVPAVPPLATASDDARVGALSRRDTNHIGRAKSANGSAAAPPAPDRDEVSIPGQTNRGQDFADGVSNHADVPTSAARSDSASEIDAPADVRLAREVKSVDRTRTLVKRGDAAGALRELDAFDRQFGYSILQREATLVRIDVLLALGRNADASALARPLLAASAPGERARLEKQLEKKGLSP